MSSVPSQQEISPQPQGQNEAFHGPWHPPSPKFDILASQAFVPHVGTVALVAFNEEAAKRLYQYVRDCGCDEGDDWIWALINHLEGAFNGRHVGEKRLGRRVREGSFPRPAYGGG